MAEAQKSVSGLGGIFFLARITRKAINIRLTRSGLTDNHRHRHTHTHVYTDQWWWWYDHSIISGSFLYQSNLWYSHVILSYPLTLWCQSVNDSIQTNPNVTMKKCAFGKNINDFILVKCDLVFYVSNTKVRFNTIFADLEGPVPIWAASSRIFLLLLRHLGHFFDRFECFSPLFFISRTDFRFTLCQWRKCSLHHPSFNKCAE